MNSVDKKVLTLVALVILAMAGLSMATWTTSAKLGRLSSDFTRMSAVEAKLQGILFDASEAQRFQRDFLLTSEPSSLVGCQEALLAINDRLRELRRDLKSKEVAAELTQIDAVLVGEVQAISESLALRKTQGLKAAADRLARGGGGSRLAELRKIVEKSRALEAELMKTRQEEIAAAAMAVPRAAVAALFVVLLLGALVGWLIHKEIQRRVQVEEALKEKSDILYSVLHNMGDGVMVADLEGKFLVANPTARRFFGKDLQRLTPGADLTPWGIFKPDSLPCAYEELPLVKAIQGQPTDDMELSVRNPQVPEGRLLLASGRPLRDVQHRVVGGIVVFRDVTRQKQAEREMQEINKRMQDAVTELEMHNLEVGMLAKFMESMQACESMQEIGGAALPMLKGLFAQPQGAIFSFPKAGGRRVEPLISWGEKGVEAPLPFNSGQCWALRRGRSHFQKEGGDQLACPHLAGHPAKETLCVPMVAQGEFLGLLNLASPREGSIDERTLNLAAVVAEQLSLAMGNLRLRENLRELSLRDALTGLHNRRYFEEALEREFALAMARNQPLTLFMVDIDHFKRFNDDYGHEAGDEVLKAVGKELSAQMPQADLMCRLGGEEMVGLVPGEDLDKSMEIAERMRKAVGGLRLSSRGTSLRNVTISVGLAAYPSDASTPQELLRRSDEALYQAKKDGRNRCVRWNREIVVEADDERNSITV